MALLGVSLEQSHVPKRWGWMSQGSRAQVQGCGLKLQRVLTWRVSLAPVASL